MTTTQRSRTLRTLLIATLALVGCAEEKEARVPPAPPPTYNGPEFLRTTIGSVSGLRGYDPVLVSGYGLVVNLHDTGSPDVPPTMRDWLLDQMGKRGFGSANTGMPSPEQALASNRVALVLVEGVIPPGATEGTRFDLLVTALPETQTTSLDGGVLYTTDLRVGGVNFGASQASDLANGRGPIFLNPFLEPNSTAKIDSDPRIGRVLSGGMVTTDMNVQIVTNQESYRLTSQIANRVNGRFPQAPADRNPVAVALDANVIQINIPLRYKNNPQRLLDVVQRLYLNPTATFTQEKAVELAQMLRDPANERYADNIALALEGMGKTIIPVIRDYYTLSNEVCRLAALQAGARLEDTKTAELLFEMARAGKPGIAERAADSLGDLLRARPDNERAAAMLRTLLDSDDARVRMTALDALATVKDRTVQGNRFPEKLEIVRVHCDKPMVYVTRSGIPRVVIFNDRLGFEQPMLFSADDNRFMVRAEPGQPSAQLFYQRLGAPKPMREDIPLNVAYLVGTMAYKPGEDAKSAGFDMSYSQIVAVLYQLTKNRSVDAPFVLQSDGLVQEITARRAVVGAVEEGRAESATQKPEHPIADENKTGDNPKR